MEFNLEFLNYTVIIMVVIYIVLILCVSYLFINRNNIIEKMQWDKNKLSSVAIVGTARDLTADLDKTIEIIEMISSLFNKSYIIIYENDSVDDTLNKLNEWKSKNKKVEIITEKNVTGSRTERLAHGRNILLKKALEKHVEYMVVIDLDDVNHGLTKDAFLSSFEYSDWAVMTANQSTDYYDLYALRTYDDWMPFCCWYCNQFEEKGYDECVGKRLINISSDKDPILVKSAFGGLGIYKTKYLENTEYRGQGSNEEVASFDICEHVPLNHMITKKGGKIYINPKMINH